MHIADLKDRLRFKMHLVLVGCVTAASAPCSYGGATTDGTMGTVQSLSGNFTIPQTLGTVIGGNLFHSFQNFSINTGESATFTTTSSLSNVISRVTGGTASAINGQLRLSAATGAPNFFLINPAGVTFGAGASVDVPAGFHVSTADYLRFADGRTLYANPYAGSSLTSASPSAFGFLGVSSATVTVKEGATIAAKVAQPISIVAGDVEIDNATVATQGGNIVAIALGTVGQEVNVGEGASTAKGRLDIRNGGRISAPSDVGVNGGMILVEAGEIAIDGQGVKTTGIYSEAGEGAAHAGSISVSASGNLSIAAGARISSSTSGDGHAGSILISAVNIAIDGKGATTGIFSRSESGAGSGNAGSVSVSTNGGVSLVNGGVISSSTFTAGTGGTVKVKAGSIAIDGGDDTSGIFSLSNTTSSGSPNAGDAGSVAVTVDGAISIANGWISSSTSTLGKAGAVQVNAGSLSIDGKGYRFGAGVASESKIDNPKFTNGGDAAGVDVNVRGDLSIVDGGIISSSTSTSGNAGQVTVKANNIFIDGHRLFNGTGILSDTYGISGNAGNVDVLASGNLNITKFGAIASSTSGNGNAGAVKVRAANIRLEEMGGIFSEACNFRCSTTISGNAGRIDVAVTGELSMLAGGRVSSSTWTRGAAGALVVDADRIVIDGQDDAASTGIMSDNIGIGDGGSVTVNAAKEISILQGGRISAFSTFLGSAGSIKIDAGAVTIDGRGADTETGILSLADQNVDGNAGDIVLNVRGKLFVKDGGKISSSTDSNYAASAGSIRIVADSIELDARNANGIATGIFTQAHANNSYYLGSTGNAGDLDITANGSLAVKNGAEISSSTYFAGKAGDLRLRAGTVEVADASSVESIAGSASSGKNGNIDIAATRGVYLSGLGRISIQNDATVPDDARNTLGTTVLKLDAPIISLRNGVITAAASGNVNASNIALSYSDRMVVDPSSIATSAVDGNGGKIGITGTGPLVVDRSQITTSVLGNINGNGGNIDITSPVLVLNTGFIQANTAARAATGGEVNINVNAVISSGNALTVGSVPLVADTTRFGFNVIQAARPDGVNGAIQILSPQIDLSGSLNALNAQIVDFGNLVASDLCRLGTASSLTVPGRGGMPLLATGWLRP